jgi:HEPN domain-containing protein
MPQQTNPRSKKQAKIHLKLSLQDNAYSFLNQSLRSYRKTNSKLGEWPFALLHMTQCLELLLKQLLKDMHPILIYEDVDRPNRTVSLDQALIRLEHIGVQFEEKERRNIKKAAEYRNYVVHYEVEINKFEWKNTYAQLFEFIHFFHHKHLKSEIHNHIDKDNWAAEARLMRYFKKNFVIYNCVEMAKSNPKEILDAQKETHIWFGLKAFSRFKYGDEPMWLQIDPTYAKIPCHDCGVIKGQYHAERCDMEQCPKCKKQLLGCGCWIGG